MDINEEKLLEVYKHASSGGSLKPRAIGAIVKLRGNPIGNGNAYLAALKERWPDEFGDQPVGNAELPDDEESEDPAPESVEDDDDDAGLGTEEEDEEEPAPPPPAPAPVAEKATPAVEKILRQEKADVKTPKPTTTVVKGPAEAPAVTKVFLENPDGTSEKLEILSSQGGAIVVRKAVPKDEVTIMLKGQPVVVDIEDLKRRPAGTLVHELPVSRLIELAEAAK